MKSSFFVILALVGITLTGCADKSRRAEIEQRKAVLISKQDSALAEAQQRLGVVDSLLEVAKREHDRQYELVMRGSTKYNERSPEVLRLNRLRQHRDSLQVEWETLGAKIRYIKKVKQ